MAATFKVTIGKSIASIMRTEVVDGKMTGKRWEFPVAEFHAIVHAYLNEVATIAEDFNADNR